VAHLGGRARLCARSWQGYPAAERRAERANSANSFETIAREWLDKQPFAPKTLCKVVWTFEDLLFPYIGPGLSRP